MKFIIKKKEFMKQVIQCLTYFLIISLFPLNNNARGQTIDHNGLVLQIVNDSVKVKKASLQKIQEEQSDVNYSQKSAKDTVRKVQTVSSNSSILVPIGNGIIQKPIEVTAAVSIVTAEELSKNRLSLNAVNALYGRLNGLFVLDNATTSPPTGASLFIRGRSTFTNSSPLVLVDGFERPLNSLTEVGGLSIDEIKSITVLKDAAALARYGQRGANGVILVKTKRGEKGPLHVSVSYEQGVTLPKSMPNFVDAYTYARAVNEARKNDNLSMRYGKADLKLFKSGDAPYLYPNVNWFNKALRDAGTRLSLNASVSGGNDLIRYFVFGSAVGDNGIFGPVDLNDNYVTQLKYRRFNFRSNVDINITDNLLFSTNLAASFVERNVPSAGGGANRIFNALYSIPSAAFPVKTPSGHFGGNNRHGNNPVAVLTSSGFGKPNSRKYLLTGRLKRDMSDFVKGLSAEATFSYFVLSSFAQRTTQNFIYESYNPVRNQAGTIVDAAITQYGQETPLDFNSYFNYQRRYVDIVGKVNYRRVWNKLTLETMLSFHQFRRAYQGQDNVFRHQNFAGNIRLGFLNKYFFDVSFSYSGNNYLPPDNRFGFFPGVSAGWVISREDFLKDAQFLNLLKLRVSWGLTGSSMGYPTGNIYQQKYVPAYGYRFGNSNQYHGGFRQGRLPTRNFTYETSAMYNVGLDAKLFGNIEFSTNIFYEHRYNILTNSVGTVSGVLGVRPSRQTNGVVNNKGFEARLEWHETFGDFSYKIGGRFSFVRNKIVNMNEQYRPYDYLKRTGEQVGQRFGLVATGFFKNKEDILNSPTQTFSNISPGDIKYLDVNADGVINKLDEVPLGHASGYPETYYSFSLSMQYKNFGIFALIQGTGNYSAYLNTRSVYRPLVNNNTISKYYYNHRWTPKTADTAIYPRLTTQSNRNNSRVNSLWLVNKSYLKLRVARIYYSFPESITTSLNIRDIKIYLNGYNLFSIDNIPVLGSEHLSSVYPFLRTFSIGIKARF